MSTVWVDHLLFPVRMYSSDIDSVSTANEEYYQLLMTNDSQPSGPDVSSYTIEEIDSITSEYTLKNKVSNWVNDHWVIIIDCV